MQLGGNGQIKFDGRCDCHVLLITQVERRLCTVASLNMYVGVSHIPLDD